MNTVKPLLRQKGKNNSGAIRRNQKLQRSRIDINLQSHVELQKRKKDVDYKGGTVREDKGGGASFIIMSVGW